MAVKKDRDEEELPRSQPKKAAPKKAAPKKK